MTDSPQQPHQSHKGSKIKMNSKFQLVIATAKRSKQIANEAKAKGLSPNQVALVRSKCVKPTTLALEELKAGKVRYGRHQRFPSEIEGSQEQPLDVEDENSDSHHEPFEPGGIEVTESKC